MSKSDTIGNWLDDPILTLCLSSLRVNNSKKTIKMTYKKGDILISVKKFKNSPQEGFEAEITALEILRVYEKPRGLCGATYSVKLLSENFISTMNDERLGKEGYFKTMLWTMEGDKAFDEEDLGSLLKKRYYKPLHRQFKKEFPATLKKI